jgi:hypothetical protein
VSQTYCRSLLKRLARFALAMGFALCLLPSGASAFELFPYVGVVDRAPVSGDNRHQDPNTGYGVFGRIPNLGQFGDVEVVGFSDFKWSEFSAAKYYYLLGKEPQVDPLSTKDMKITRFSQWNISLSGGVGFYSHNTTTNKYNLPILVTGAELVTRSLFAYTINDQWSAGALISLGVAISTIDANFNFGYGLGAGYRF